jgi:hypothetical protein
MPYSLRMSFRFALLLLLGVFILNFSRILFYGEVIFPHSNAIESGVYDKQIDPHPSNRKFSDENSVFIPELANNLSSNRKAWFATWNPHVELGRVAFQLYGLGRACPLTNLLSCFTSNPFLLYTALVLLTVGLTGSFLLLFLRALGLPPLACAVSALGISFTTFVSYWLTFVMFLSAICWSICLLWLITEFTQKRSWIVALGLAFATYSLLMTAYPQINVLCAYIIGAYGLTRLGQMPGSGREKLRTALVMLACAGAGALASLPGYLDLFFVARDSARLEGVSDSFFLGVLPPGGGWPELTSFLITIFDWSWLGNAIAPAYPKHFNGLSFTPVYGSLIWASFLLKNRRAVLFWQLILSACLAATIFPTVYLFAVHHLGFGLSRIQLLVGGIIPGFVLSAFAVDSIFRNELRLTIRSAAWLLLPVTAEVIIALLAWRKLPIDAVAVGATLLLVGGLLASIYWRSITTLVGIAILSVLFYGRPLILSRPLGTIHTSSELINAIKSHTPGGSRFAIGDRAIESLPPNQEVLFGLQSVNSYDSLSSRRYQELVRRWSTVGTRTYGRNFKFLEIESALGDQTFPFSNVDIILSSRLLKTGQLALAAEVDGIKLYQPVAAPIGLLQTPLVRFSNAKEVMIDPALDQENLPSRQVEVLNDFQKIRVTASPRATLLFLSQQYHRAWRAESRHQPLRAVMVNRFYQGVIVPPNTSEIELSFRPFVLWSWLPQIFFAGCGALWLLRRFLHIRRDHAANAT